MIGIVVKVAKIDIRNDLEEIDIENSNVNVFVETDDDYIYVFTVGTPKILQFLMDKEKTAYFGPS